MQNQYKIIYKAKILYKILLNIKKKLLKYFRHIKLIIKI